MASSSPLLETYYKARQSLAGGDLQGAGQLCRQILEADPEYAYGHFLMALLFKATGDLQKSLMFADMALKIDATRHEFHTLAAELMYHARDFARGEQFARKALQLSPNDFNALEQLFGALREQGKVDESNRLMVRLLEMKALQQGLQVGADVRHFKAVVEEGVSMKSAPEKFVETHFDGYAQTFDEHLQKDLQYRIPGMIADALDALGIPPADEPFSLLDLGCGTGLVAAALKQKPALCVGVDLSQGMLDKARAKSLYTELHKADIVDYMRRDDRRYRLVVAADVLVYIGDVEPLFREAGSRLLPGGVFGFSVESCETGEAYRLNASDRYCHDRRYLDALAAEYGFEEAHSEGCAVRTEKGRPAAGFLILLKKKDK